MSDDLSWFNLLSTMAGGLAIFLLGMKYMSDGMQAVAGERLRSIIHLFTNNRLTGCFAGFFTTCIIQSSSITTVMVVGMVSAGLMTLVQSIGVILGADIGTTITAWIIASDAWFKHGVLIYGLPLVGLSGFFFLFAKNERVRFASMFFMGLGLVFFGLWIMKSGVAPIKSDPDFKAWFSKFTPDSLWGVVMCVLAGMILTGIVQSSSATVGITLVLASDQVLSLETAFALVIGENAGTTVTAFLASLGASRNAQRSAYAHILIKIVGCLWAIPILWLGMEMLRSLLEPFPTMVAVALFHTGFNIINVAIFMPLINVLAGLLVRFFPDKTVEDESRSTYLDVRLLKAPALGIEQSHEEVVRMGQKVESMLALVGVLLQKPVIDEVKARSLKGLEKQLDVFQREIIVFLSKLLAGNVSLKLVGRGRKQLRIAEEYESISDHLVRIVKVCRKLQIAGGKFSPETLGLVLDLHGRVAGYFMKINGAVASSQSDILGLTMKEAESITQFIKELWDTHLQTFTTEQVTPLASLAFSDLLTVYRQAQGHAVNIAQALAGDPSPDQPLDTDSNPDLVEE